MTYIDWEHKRTLFIKKKMTMIMIINANKISLKQITVAYNECVK